MRFIIALSSLAPQLRYTVNLVPVILPACSKLSISRLVPISQCAFGSKSNLVGSPHLLTSTLSSLSLPKGTDSSGRLGIAYMSSLSELSTSDSSSSSAFILSPSSRIFLMRSSQALPSLFICAISAETLFFSALSASTSLMISFLRLAFCATSAMGKCPLLPLRRSSTYSMLSQTFFKSNIYTP